MARVAAHQEELKSAGAWVFFGALTSPSSATVVRAHDGDLSMTDGPYAEAKEQIGGFMARGGPPLPGRARFVSLDPHEFAAIYHREVGRCGPRSCGFSETSMPLRTRSLRRSP